MSYGNKSTILRLIQNHKPFQIHLDRFLTRRPGQSHFLQDNSYQVYRYKQMVFGWSDRSGRNIQHRIVRSGSEDRLCYSSILKKHHVCQIILKVCKPKTKCFKQGTMYSKKNIFFFLMNFCGFLKQITITTAL